MSTPPSTDKPDSEFEKKLIPVLMKFGIAFDPVSQPNNVDKITNQALADVKQATLALVLEIIGEDDTNRWGGTLDISEREVNRNALRKKQRQLAKRILS